MIKALGDKFESAYSAQYARIIAILYDYLDVMDLLIYYIQKKSIIRYVLENKKAPENPTFPRAYTYIKLDFILILHKVFQTVLPLLPQSGVNKKCALDYIITHYQLTLYIKI